MSTKNIWLVLLLVLTGCGGAAPKEVESPRGTGQSSVPAEAPASFDRETSTPAAPPAPPPAKGDFKAGRPGPAAPAQTEARAPEPSPESRPGLGTEWGETRTSRVHDVTFVRDSSRPFALAALHYNDRRGVDAMANLHAQRDTQRAVSTGGGAVSIAIKDANGSPLEAVHVGDRTLVVGQAGQRYSIVLSNHTDHRFEAVVTVDGLDVVNGKPGSMENRGYVLLPFATLEIEGFRQSHAAVAAFRFASVGESYAAQMGSARNVGVIGVALFSERGDNFLDPNDTRLRDTASPFPADPRFAAPPRR
jgi:hypothetical protein